MEEFDSSVKLLREKSFNLIILDKSEVPELQKTHLPDAVFPN